MTFLRNKLLYIRSYFQTQTTYSHSAHIVLKNGTNSTVTVTDKSVSSTAGLNILGESSEIHVNQLEILLAVHMLKSMLIFFRTYYCLYSVWYICKQNRDTCQTFYRLFRDDINYRHPSFKLDYLVSYQYI